MLAVLNDLFQKKHGDFWFCLLVRIPGKICLFKFNAKNMKKEWKSYQNDLSKSLSWRYFALFSSISSADFEQLNVCWA